MDSIIAQIQALAQNTDEAGRLNIIQSLKRVKNELQSPKDTLMELVVPVCGNILRTRVHSRLTVVGTNECDAPD
jgi:demethylsterigmatocystin 6-O-methyltransferase